MAAKNRYSTITADSFICSKYVFKKSALFVNVRSDVNIGDMLCISCASACGNILFNVEKFG